MLSEYFLTDIMVLRKSFAAQKLLCPLRRYFVDGVLAHINISIPAFQNSINKIPKKQESLIPPKGVPPFPLQYYS